MGKPPQWAAAALKCACLASFLIHIGSSNLKTYRTITVGRCTESWCHNTVFSGNILTGKKQRNCIVCFCVLNRECCYCQELGQVLGGAVVGNAWNISPKWLCAHAPSGHQVLAFGGSVSSCVPTNSGGPCTFHQFRCCWIALHTLLWLFYGLLHLTKCFL